MRTTETVISRAVLIILAQSQTGELSIDEIKGLIPDHVQLTPQDMVLSDTRPKEPLWEQIVRNIVSHQTNDNNIIAQGYATHPKRGSLKITDAGRTYIS